MKNPGTSDHSIFRIAQLAAAISIASFFYYLRHGDLLLYGDAVAHINIARRVFDSHTPGLLQLGTVWLPLPHLVMLPFLVSRWMWQTGIGGSIPSLIAYVFSVTGIFRLMQTILPDSRESRNGREIQFAAWLATAIFALNPNLIYLQTTAMTEPVYLALFIWTVVFLSDAIKGCATGETRKANSSLVNCGFCLFGACLTRYDGWLLAAMVVSIASSLAWLGNFAALRPGVKKLVLLAAAAPLLWLAYNAAVYGNPLEFANGPYSAKAIEQRTAQPGYPAHPGAANVVTAASFFLKSAELNMAAGNWCRLWLVIALAGFFLAMKIRAQRAVLLLWVPVVFYALSIAYRGVPLFLPPWWPFTWYNLRYGLQLLPLFAVSAAVIVSAVAAIAAPEGAVEKRPVAPSLKRWPDTNLLWRGTWVVVWVFVVVSYFFVWKAQPLCFTEAWVNSRSKLALE